MSLDVLHGMKGMAGWGAVEICRRGLIMSVVTVVVVFCVWSECITAQRQV